MKQILIPVFALSLVAIPTLAQEVEAPELPKSEEIDEGFDLMEEGAKLLLRGLLQQMEPAIDELEAMTDEMGEAMKLLGEEMGPALIELMTKIDDMRHYSAPEVLPNGDIIIRRSPDAPVYTPESETGEIDL